MFSNKKLIVYQLSTIVAIILFSQIVRANDSDDVIFDCLPSFGYYAYGVGTDDAFVDGESTDRWQLRLEIPRIFTRGIERFYINSEVLFSRINDNQQEIWIKLDLRGLGQGLEYGVYNSTTNEFRRVSASIEDLNLVANQLFVDYSGNVWGIVEQSADADDPYTSETGYYPNVSEFFAFAYFEDAGQQFKLAEGEPIFVIRKNELRFTPEIQVVADHNLQVFWLFDETAIYRYDPQTQISTLVHNFSEEGYVKSADLASTGELYFFRNTPRELSEIITHQLNSLFVLTPETNNVQLINDPSDAIPNAPNLLVDHQDNLWLGSIGYRDIESDSWEILHPNLEFALDVDAQIRLGRIFGWGYPEVVLADSAGRIWFAGRHETPYGASGLAWYDPSTGQGCNNIGSTNIIEDHNGKLWFFTSTGKLYQTVDPVIDIDAPVLSPISDTIDTTPDFTWTAVDGVESYLLSVSSTSISVQESFDAADICNPTECSGTLGQPLTPDTYSASVQGVTADVRSEPSNEITFKILDGLERLRLTSMCSPDPNTSRVWRVRNTNPVAVDFTWDVVGTEQTGSGTVPAGTPENPAQVFFETETIPDSSNTTRIFVNGEQQDVKASTPDACEPEIVIDPNRICPADTPVIDFNSNPPFSYGATQDINGQVLVEADGTAIRLTGNTWKQIAFPYSVTSQTILEFDFQSSLEAEIHGIGFDAGTNNQSISRRTVYNLYGTQSWGRSDVPRYTTSAPDVMTYSIPVGADYQGEMAYLTFVNDHDDANALYQSTFANVRVCEFVEPVPPPDATTCTAQSVMSYIAGTSLASDGLLDTRRTNPTRALGNAQGNDTLNFVSLGFGGEIVLDFQRRILNQPGDDIRIIETTYTDAARSWLVYPEQALVYASQDGVTWVALGVARKDMGFDLGTLDWARYIRLVDVSERGYFIGSGRTTDGFDVDAVEAISMCE